MKISKKDFFVHYLKSIGINSNVEIRKGYFQAKVLDKMSFKFIPSQKKIIKKVVNTLYKGGSYEKEINTEELDITYKNGNIEILNKYGTPVNIIESNFDVLRIEGV